MPTVGNKAQVVTSFSATGVYEFSAFIANNGSTAADTTALIVQKAATTTVLTSSPNSQSVTATITVTAPGSGGPTGTVQFYNKSTLIGSASLIPGQGASTASIYAPAGSLLVAIYLGDANFTGSTSAVLSGPQPSITLSSSANPSLLGKSVTFTLSVGPVGAFSGGTAQFFDGATLLAAATINGGQALYSTSALTAGPHTIVATYGGQTVSLSQVVNPLLSSVTLSTSASMVTFGQSITLMALLGPAAPAGVGLQSGQVAFRDNGANIGYAVISSGVATLALQNLPIGQHQFQAIYGGDLNWTATQSTVSTVMVAPAVSITTLIPSLIRPGQAILTATVTAGSNASGTPTGSVQFLDAVTKALITTAMVNGGQAIASLTFAQVIADGGPRPIAAVYSGDSQFASSSSAPLSVPVNAASFQALAIAPDEMVTLWPPTGFAPKSATISNISNTEGAQVLANSAAQISFVVPSDLADGLVVITIGDGSEGAISTLANVARTAPGFFTADASGQGLAAGYVVRVAPDSSQTTQAAAHCDTASNTCIAVPVSSATAGEHLFLSLYATGLRHATQGAIAASVNGASVPVTYAGPQTTYPGLDQVNLDLSALPPLSGEASVVITVDGQPANRVAVTFQ
ncbi:MAG: Ig-like domain repeat protein [Acidobacteriia bacterium]|nr:Ig-like domain repeat protein [Terriglobia bacterium]MBV8903431.1 Ig-like domain repeat protein [Terriglobia bacterium]